MEAWCRARKEGKMEMQESTIEMWCRKRMSGTGGATRMMGGLQKRQIRQLAENEVLVGKEGDEWWMKQMEQKRMEMRTERTMRLEKNRVEMEEERMRRTAGSKTARNKAAKQRARERALATLAAAKEELEAARDEYAKEAVQVGDEFDMDEEELCRHQWKAGELEAEMQPLRVLIGEIVQKMDRGGGTVRALCLQMLSELLESYTTRVQQLLKAEHRVWRAVQKWRMGQRLLVVVLSKVSRRRGFRKMNAFVMNDLDDVIRAYTENGGGVYVRVNVNSHRWRYFGRTSSFERRDQQHLREEGRGVLNVSEDQRQKSRFYYRFVSRHGGAGAWVDLPVVQVEPGMSVDDWNRLETWYIKRWGTLNIIGNPRMRKMSSRRRRPVRKMRGRREGWYQVPKRALPTVYTCEGRQEVDFMRLVLRAQEVGKELVVEVRQGSLNVTRFVKLRRELGESRVQVEYCDGYVLNGTVKSMIWCRSKCAMQLETIKTIKIVKVVHAVKLLSGGRVQDMLPRVCARVYGKRDKVLRGLTYGEVKLLHKMVGGVQHEERKRIGMVNLQRYARKCWGVRVGFKPVLRVASVSMDTLQAAKRGAVLLLRRAKAPVALKGDMIRRLRPVRVKPRTIERVLCTWRKDCCEYDETVDSETLCN